MKHLLLTRITMGRKKTKKKLDIKKLDDSPGGFFRPEKLNPYDDEKADRAGSSKSGAQSFPVMDGVKQNKGTL